MIAALVMLWQAAATPAAPPAVVHLDYSWLRYCYETKDPGCVAEKITPFDLAIINKEITEGIITREDDSYYDPWVPFPPDRMGDCDDRAASTRQALLALGVDPKAIRFETGLVKEPDGRQLGHIVVVVNLDGKEWVLDSKTPDRVYPPSKRPYSWTPMATESPNILWSIPVKPRRVIAGPSPEEVRAMELSVLFAQAGWRPSMENFAPRPFVMWHGAGFFSVAGYPNDQGCCSKCCRTEAEVIAFLEAMSAPTEPLSVDTPSAAALVNAAEEGPREYPEAVAVEPDPRDEELKAALARAAAAEARVAELEAEKPQQLPPNPAEAKLSDYGPVGSDRPIPENVAKLMVEDPSLTITEAFEKRINTLNNARLLLTITPEESEELSALLDHYHDLAKRGDRS